MVTEREDGAMPIAAANGIEIAYETFGDPADPSILLISGLGAQLIAWDDDFCLAFVDRGFHVIVFDNRDIGLSTKIDVGPNSDLLGAVMAAFSGRPIEPVYQLWDMADDSVGLLDAIDVESAHVVGLSMGGMIGQAMAIRHRQRVRSLTSIMSHTSDADVGKPKPEILPTVLAPPPMEREAAIAHAVEVSRLVGASEHFDEGRALARATAQYDRCFFPDGVGHHLLAVLTSESRSDDLRNLEINALVIHGDADPLFGLDGGERTAKVIPGADLLILEGMAHDIPPYFWPPIVEAITALAARS